MSQNSLLFDQEMIHECERVIGTETIETILNDITNDTDVDNKNFVMLDLPNAMDINHHGQHIPPPSMYSEGTVALYQAPPANMYKMFYSGHDYPQSNKMIQPNEDYPGNYNFEIALTSETSGKYSWVYSLKLNKVFITMGNQLPVHFKWLPPRNDLFVRATPLFSLAEHSQDTVVRCLNHSSELDKSNLDVPRHILPHVVRCNNINSEYFGGGGKFLSVRTPLGQPQPGTDSVRLTYSFMCQHSCTTGINRKPMEVVYTLEDRNENVLGRRKHGVRICSCPKRDKEKFEKEKDERDAIAAGAIVPTKKRKMRESSALNKKLCIRKEEPSDVGIYRMDFEIIGIHNVKKLLELAYAFMAADTVKLKENVPIVYKDCMEKIQNLLNSHE